MAVVFLTAGFDFSGAEAGVGEAEAGSGNGAWAGGTTEGSWGSTVSSSVPLLLSLSTALSSCYFPAQSSCTPLGRADGEQFPFASLGAGGRGGTTGPCLGTVPGLRCGAVL